MDKDTKMTIFKSGISCIPWAGGIINEFISLYQGKFTEKRLQQIEKLLDYDEKKIFENNINNLNEEEYFLARKIIKFHLFEAEPIVSEMLARFIVQYILKNERTQMNYLITVLCQLDSSDIFLIKKIKEEGNQDKDGKFSWKDISPYEVEKNDKESKISLYSLIATNFKNKDGTFNLENNMLGISFMKLEKLNIIISDFVLYVEENNVRNVEHFYVTALGKMIMEYI